MFINWLYEHHHWLYSHKHLDTIYNQVVMKSLRGAPNLAWTLNNPWAPPNEGF